MVRKVRDEVLRDGHEGQNKKQALDAALSQIQKAFGKGAVMRLGENSHIAGLESISTGSLGLDLALGIGGLPKGRVVEIYGPESSGKTTLALHVIAEAQKAGITCAFIDAEHALDPIYAGKLGVKNNDLLISQPDCGEQALEITDTLVRSGGVGLIVIDSVAALTPRAELEGEMGDSLPGIQARLMSQALRKLTGSISRTNCMVVFINQIRMKIGVMFGSPETTSGGNALKFYSSVRLDIRRIGAIKEREEMIGNQTRVKVVKNKVAPPFRIVEFDIMYGQGISKMGELLDIGVNEEMIEKSGSWYSLAGTDDREGERIGQGKESARKFLLDNPEIAADIEARIRVKLAPKAESATLPEESDKAPKENNVETLPTAEKAKSKGAASDSATRGSAAGGSATSGNTTSGSATSGSGDASAADKKSAAEASSSNIEKLESKTSKKTATG